MTGILPFILWLYCHKQVMISLVQNRPLLYFPGVDPFDLIFARMIVEIPTSTLVVIIVMGALAVTGYGSVPANFPSFLGALGQAWLLGVGTGLVVGGLVHLLGLVPCAFYAGMRHNINISIFIGSGNYP